MTPEVVQAVLDRLNALLNLDPCAVRTLLEAKTLVNEDLAREIPDPLLLRHALGDVRLRPLGLLNAALMPCGITIGVRYDADGNPVRFEPIATPRK